MKQLILLILFSIIYIFETVNSKNEKNYLFSTNSKYILIKIIFRI